MNVQDFGVYLERLQMLYFGISLLLSFPVIIALSQVGLAIRELTLNSRKEDHSFSDTEYKVLEWLCYFFFITGICGGILGIVFIYRAY